jgi:heme/copper-type cytochrome/quinol oxidase subunit 2
MFFITFIFFFVLVIMARTLQFFSFNKVAHSDPVRGNNVVHGTTIEVI